jgi:hypothetical protein
VAQFQSHGALRTQQLPEYNARGEEMQLFHTIYEGGGTDPLTGA